ncbi:hypothetical protein C8F01DRAFT_1368440 [Mycena amicta]|nr:hypothetical protein C8F01DRAFT_1368440 [Mycena amicta]
MMDVVHPFCSSCAFTPSELLPSLAQTNNLHSLLRTNIAPRSPADLEHAVAFGTLELARYDQGIEDFRKKAQILSEERATLASYIDGCRSVLDSHIRRMPTELVTRILELCALSSSKMYRLSYDDSQEDELARLARSHLLDLAKVCARWRDIIMNTSTLWASVTFNTSLLATADLGNCQEVLRSVLSRSGGLPLTIRIAATRNTKPASRLLEIMAKEVHRWRSATFQVPDSLLAPLKLKGQLPLLESLELHAVSLLKGEYFSEAPNLHTFAIKGPPHTIPLLPWRQLRSFTYDPRSSEFAPEDIRSVPLTELPSGASFVLSAIVSASRPRMPLLPPVTSPIDLLKLCVGDRERHAPVPVLGRIFNCLTLPHLTQFILEPREAAFPGSEPPLWSHTEFMDLATRSSFDKSLVKLTILTKISEEALLSALAGLPRLEDLTITDLPAPNGHILVTDALLRALNLTVQYHPPGVPRLRSLTITSRLSFDTNVLESLVESRVALLQPGPFYINIGWLDCAGRDRIDNLAQTLETLRERHPRRRLCFGTPDRGLQ